MPSGLEVSRKTVKKKYSIPQYPIMTKQKQFFRNVCKFIFKIKKTETNLI